MTYRCPWCRQPAHLFNPGTTTPEHYFQGRSYAIAEGDLADRLPMYRCRQCGHGFTPIAIDPAHLTKWYAAAKPDTTFLADEAARRKTARTMVQKIQKYTQVGKLLDIGAGPGIFVSQAVRQGWQATGLEPSGWAVQHAQAAYGATIIQADMSALPADIKHTYDVATLFDVIEHVVSPSVLLTHIATILKPNGLLVITTPRFDSLVARVMGRKWYCIFPSHLHYFTLASLQTALHNTGFTLVASRSHTRYVSLAYLWHRIQTAIGLTKDKPFTGKKRSITVPWNVGDEFEVYARKK